MINFKNKNISEIKWQEAWQKLPKKSGYYLVVCKSWNVSILNFSTKYKQFNVLDDDKSNDTAIPVIWWAELPQPPIKI